MNLNPKDPFFPRSSGFRIFPKLESFELFFLNFREAYVNPIERYAWGLPPPCAPNWDFSYIDYYKKAYANTADTDPNKQSLSRMILDEEALKEFKTPSLKNIKPLIQLDNKPNLEIIEPKWELYKVSLSWQTTGEFM